MQHRDIVSLAQLRLLVGFLGEKDQFGWWTTSVSSSSGLAFLTPPFPRSLRIARYEMLYLAAQRVHDQRVGIGEVFHLFRLPDDLEQLLHDSVRDPRDGDVSLPQSHEEAIAALESLAASTSAKADGPVRIGRLEDVRARRTWVEAAGYYLNAFVTGHQVHPYLADR